MGNEDSRAQGVRRAFWPKLAGNLARLPFAEDVVAAYYCAVDLATPLRAKGILMAREFGHTIPVTDTERRSLNELGHLRRSIGRIGLLAMRPILGDTERDVWQLRLLQD